MREIHKKIALPLGGAPQEFRLTKLDAFSGARLLKLLSAATTDDLQALLLSLPDDVLEALQRTCLRSASVLLPAGPVRVLEGDCWGLPVLEYDPWTCLRLTVEVISWTLEGFFPEGGPAS